MQAELERRNIRSALIPNSVTPLTDPWTKARFPLPELTARVNGPCWRARFSTSRVDGPSTRLVKTRSRQHGPRWRVGLMETGHPSTRAVNSGSGNRALVPLPLYPYYSITSRSRSPDCRSAPLRSAPLTCSGRDGLFAVVSYREATIVQRTAASALIRSFFSGTSIFWGKASWEAASKARGLKRREPEWGPSEAGSESLFTIVRGSEVAEASQHRRRSWGVASWCPDIPRFDQGTAP